MVTSADRRTASTTFASLNPATGEVVGTYPVHDHTAVGDAVARARVAGQWWWAVGYEERKRRLLAAKGIFARRSHELCALVRAENGKPAVDALIEVLLTVNHLDWAARSARRTLGPRRVGSGLLMLNQRATVEYHPLGVVGVIGPWNYPVLTPMGSIIYALAAGNAVVFKPSELTPAVGEWLVEAVAAVVPEHHVLQLVTGGGETGAALCRSGVDKVAFTGSARTGRTVMATCAETLTPVTMECGGNDAMIVDDDADLEAAATAAVWGSMQNAGQTCIAVERVYATEAVYDRFVDVVVDQVRRVRPGGSADAQLGPITMPAQLDTIEAHLADALDRGARAVVGGRDAVRRPYVDPVVLVDVPDDARIMREETFGPLLPITRVRDADEAVERANTGTFNLGATVFARRRGTELARRLRSGMASVNAVSAFAAIPALPFGGVGQSGFGRVHGADGLREFTRAQAVTSERFPLPFEMMSFERPEWLVRAVERFMVVRHGRR